MQCLINLSHEDANKHFLKGSSYFNGDMPNYISFEPILTDVATILNGNDYTNFKSSKPDNLPNVNYNFIANKDGKLAWRPYELMHPVIYVSLVNLICKLENWNFIKTRFSLFKHSSVECCSLPVISLDHQSDQAKQINGWWQKIEQQSLILSLEYSHVLHTDVTDCYGSLYTHSIAWALHGLETAKSNQTDKSLIGNKIDALIRASRYGQTNGISQGSALMDFIAELVLGYVDEKITEKLVDKNDYKILRYRDDYRIFTNSDFRAEEILKVISDMLRTVGMKLGTPKTFMCRNVIEGSIKPDKLAGIELQDLGEANAKTIQKQLLRLHAFGRRFPNSGALRRLVAELHTKLATQKIAPDDLEVQVAIATDIAITSPTTFPAISAILSHLISLASPEEKTHLWIKVRGKMSKVPHNGHLEIWMQRVTIPKKINLPFDSHEPICKIVNGDSIALWENSWISSVKLKKALTTSKINISLASDSEETIQPEEIALFKENAWSY